MRSIWTLTAQLLLLFVQQWYKSILTSTKTWWISQRGCVDWSLLLLPQGTPVQKLNRLFCILHAFYAWHANDRGTEQKRLWQFMLFRQMKLERNWLKNKDFAQFPKNKMKSFCILIVLLSRVKPQSYDVETHKHRAMSYSRCSPPQKYCPRSLEIALTFF